MMLELAVDTVALVTAIGKGCMKCGCSWLLEDLKARTQPLTADSPVVTVGAFKEAEIAIHSAGFGWGYLRDFFYLYFVKAGTPNYAVHFMLGHVAQREDRFRNLSMEIEFLRKEYRKIDEQFQTA